MILKTLVYGVVGLLAKKPKWKAEKITLDSPEPYTSFLSFAHYDPPVHLKAGGLYGLHTGKQWAIYDRESGDKLAEGVLE